MRFSAVLLISMSLYGVASGQSIFRISLGKTKINTDSIHFNVGEVIDARHDQKIVGVIQRRVTNRKALAMLQKPGLTEIDDVLKRSGIFEQNNGLVIRVSRFQISEITRRWEEVAKTELSIDLFISRNGQYVYLTSTYATVEMDGTDVTVYHVDNIVTCLQKALTQLSAKEKTDKPEKMFTRDQLQNPDLTFWNISSMPIVQTTKYADGFYTSFDEFINNKPSIDIGCKVKVGETHKVTCGTTRQNVNSIYGYAKDNKVYILYYQDFYQLEKKNSGFYFLGPTERSTRGFTDYNKSIFLPASMGGMPTHSKVYSIDLTSGGVENITGL